MTDPPELKSRGWPRRRCPGLGVLGLALLLDGQASAVGPAPATAAAGPAPTPVPAAAAVAAPTPACPRPLEVHGHRGARAARPENTLAAFRHALELGVDVLELDLAVTRDDVLVVSHDLRINPEICRAPGGSPPAGELPIRSLTFAELQRYDCGSLRHPRFPAQQPAPGERIPALAEVCALVGTMARTLPAARTVRLNVETKIVPGLPELSPPPEVFVRLLHAELQRHGFARRTIVQSFDHRTLRASKQLDAAIPIAMLVDETHPDLAAMARNLGAELVSPHLDWIVAEDVRALHAAGVRVVPWTANTPAQWARLCAMGVDGLITDDPAGLLAYLAGAEQQAAAAGGWCAAPSPRWPDRTGTQPRPGSPTTPAPSPAPARLRRTPSPQPRR